MTTHAYILELLMRVESKIPPPPRCHHSITIYSLGELALWVNDGKRMWPAMISENELNRPARELADDIVAEIKKAQPA